MPEPKVFVLSVSRVITRLAEAPPTIIGALARQLEGFPRGVHSHMELFSREFPQDPGAIPKTLVRLSGEISNLGIDVLVGITRGVVDATERIRSEAETMRREFLR